MSRPASTYFSTPPPPPVASASTSRHSLPPLALAPNAPPSNLDRPLNKTKGAEVGLAAWAFLLAEIIAYSQTRVDSVSDLEKRWVCVGESAHDRLATLGHQAGIRILSLLLLRTAQTTGIKVSVQIR
jgi:hypothetical protein